MTDSVALSALDWWTEAGVATLADDLPRNWLAVAPVAVRASPIAAESVKPALPDTMHAFRAWLMTDSAVPGGVRGRMDAAGDHTAGTVIVVDMPEVDDRDTGSLLSGEVGALFDRMLGAIGLDRTSIYLLPFSPARPTSGRIGDTDLSLLTPILLHHLALTSPRRLLLLGDAPVQALLRRPAAQAREVVHSVEIAGTQVPSVASIHPRLVHRKRDYRALAWGDLQRFAAL